MPYKRISPSPETRAKISATLTRAPVSRFWPNVNKDGPIPESAAHLGPCWLWTAGKVSRYGQFFNGVSTVVAHRWLWEYERGPVAVGLQLDHLCRTTRCVRPSHLEAVTSAINCQRAGNGQTRGAQQRAKTHCPQGHPYTEANTLIWGMRGWRKCRACKREQTNMARQMIRIYGPHTRVVTSTEMEAIKVK